MERYRVSIVRKGVIRQPLRLLSQILGVESRSPHSLVGGGVAGLISSQRGKKGRFQIRSDALEHDPGI